ncbi:MAG TPA: acyl-CoA dehydrogenase [Candidatus Baltobacteraceae bacterium]|nr:acyl-CoA dehydrogenase [Candidatus Baltobacteraceae bacterium]
MDFALSPEQSLIKDSVARFAAEADDGADHWPTFAELGWLAIGAPEDLGGFGGPLETLLVAEQLGRGLVVAPFVSQVVFAGTILRAADRADLLEPLTLGERRFAVAYEEPGARYDPARVTTTARRDGDGFIVGGTKVRVLDAGTATTIVVSARLGDDVALFAVPADAAGVTRTPYPAEDRHDVSTVRFEGVRLGGDAAIGDATNGAPILARGLDHTVAALCAEALGIMSAMLETTVEYTKQRVQFNVPIGSFQALQHRMAEMFVECELARSAATRAAMILDGEPDAHERAQAVSAAKVQIARSGRFVGQNAIQLHGGIGMSEEARIGQYFKRLTVLERLLGDAAFHRERYAAAAAAERTPVGATAQR